MSDTGGAVHVVRHGHTTVVTIDRPGAHNAVNGAVAAGIEAAVDEVEGDDAIWFGVLTGAGDAVFSAGADLRAAASGGGGSLSTERGGFAGFVRRARRKPWIAAVNGPAYGGGTELALACDLVVAAEHASFALPEGRVGVVAGAGGLFRLPAAVGRARAAEMCATGRPMTAMEAWRAGMVCTVAPLGETVEVALLLARRMALSSPVAVRESLAVIRESEGLDENRAWELSERAIETVRASADQREGIAAFLEKRPPRWAGR